MVLWDARQQQRPAGVLVPCAPIGGITAALAVQLDGTALTVGTKSGDVRACCAVQQAARLPSLCDHLCCPRLEARSPFHYHTFCLCCCMLSHVE